MPLNLKIMNPQENLLHIWTHNFAPGRNACSYYRIEVPLGMMYEQKLANIYEDKGHTQNEITNRNSILALMFSDIMHQYSMAGEATLHRYQSIKRRKPAMHGEHLVVPPAIIYDIDDNADFVHPFNSTYAHLGIRAYPDARLLTPGDVLIMENWEGVPEEVWADQETVYDDVLFDVQRNLHEMKIRHEVIRTADAATVSTRSLKSYFEKVIGQKNVHVFPNTIVPKHYENYEVVRKDDRVRILWQGSPSHYVDWFPLKGALARIVEKYRDKIVFVMWGSRFPWIEGIIPEDMIEQHQWAPYEAYKLRRGLLNIDINLCPLVDNVFNRGKSAIKWYEASIWARPEATLAQKTEPYHEMEHNKTGLLFSTDDEFVEMLSALIDSPDLRTRLGAGAKQWMLANRTPEATIPDLHEFYTDVRARQKRDLGLSAIKTYSTADLKKLAASSR
jgi:glycosyltransferase involved in cell wall biosynthesis